MLLGFVMVASLLLSIGQHSHAHDADSLLPAIISVEKLTWYYWEQNRFANLLPLLAWPLRGVGANLHFQLLLRALCGFASVYFALAIVGDRTWRYQRFLVAVLVMMLAGSGFVGAFFNAAVAQPVSCAVFAGGLWLLERAPCGRRTGLRRWLVVALLFWTAFVVNLSLIVFVVPLAWLARLLGAGPGLPIGRWGSCIAVSVAAVAAWGHARLFKPATPAGLNLYWGGLNDAVGAMLPDINLTVLAGWLSAAAALAFAVRRATARPAWLAAPALPQGHLAAIAMLALTSAVYANLTWVQMNGNASRYYSGVELFVLVLPATWSVTLLSRCPAPRWRRRPVLVWAWRIMLPAVAMAAVAVHAGSPGPLLFIGNTPGRPFALEEDLPRIMAHVPPDRPMIAVGSYWTAVPLVYVRLDQQGMSETYAVTDHWLPMRSTIRRLVLSGRPFTLVCLAPEASDCAARLLAWSGAGARLDVALQFGDTLASGGRFSASLAKLRTD